VIQVTPQMRILVAVEAADFRRGIDGLCRGSLQADPFTGSVFVFRNRRGTAIKLLVYDGKGFCLCHVEREILVVAFGTERAGRHSAAQ